MDGPQCPYQEDDAGLWDVKVDPPAATPLAFAPRRVGDSQFAQTASARHDIPGVRVFQQAISPSSLSYPEIHSVNSLEGMKTAFIALLSYPSH